MNSIQLLEAMNELAAQMADSARANDWDQLVEQEARLAALRQQLIEQDTHDDARNDISPDERLQKARLIEEILAHENDIRTHAEPWLGSARKLLSADVKGRAMKAAYGSVMNG